MRVWLVDDCNGVPGTLDALLRQLESFPGSGLRILGSSPCRSGQFKEIQALAPESPDLIVVRERAVHESFNIAEIADAGLALIVATSLERVERFRKLEASNPLVYVGDAPSLEALWLALQSGAAQVERDRGWKERVAFLQQRLNDRIIIERAKGFLVQRMGISEEDAYQRLRILSRRQRRQVRDIAQSLLDTQMLFVETNGQTPKKTEKPGAERSPKSH
jgi:two-component system, response regulator PdtaR